MPPPSLKTRANHLPRWFCWRFRPTWRVDPVDKLTQRGGTHMRSEAVAVAAGTAVGSGGGGGSGGSGGGDDGRERRRRRRRWSGAVVGTAVAVGTAETADGACGGHGVETVVAAVWKQQQQLAAPASSLHSARPPCELSPQHAADRARPPSDILSPWAAVVAREASDGDGGGESEGKTWRWQQAGEILSPWAAAVGEELARRREVSTLNRHPNRHRRLLRSRPLSQPPPPPPPSSLPTAIPTATAAASFSAPDRRCHRHCSRLPSQPPQPPPPLSLPTAVPSATATVSDRLRRSPPPFPRARDEGERERPEKRDKGDRELHTDIEGGGIIPGFLGEGCYSRKR
ncbi:hypothetical protein [Oryza sativa Japonica Group]|uniref:Uncharacterized protein OSJNBb0032K15.17 n=1 Tax=Oryza sativa subsp. japonica TaxID=39947 RepID=Q5VPC0_ORYSJ|nr:hypothetical protein [Oryza sativa Japonica Group]